MDLTFAEKIEADGYGYKTMEEVELARQFTK